MLANRSVKPLRKILQHFKEVEGPEDVEVDKVEEYDFTITVVASKAAAAPLDL